jgi:hypothetical protein
VVRRVTIDLDDEKFQPALMQEGVRYGDSEFGYEAGWVDGFNHFLNLASGVVFE